MPDDAHQLELQAAINAWKTRHRLRDDDPVLLVAELFHIHLNHWEQGAAKPSPEPTATQEVQDPPAPVAAAHPGVPEPAAPAAPAPPEASLRLGIGRGAAAVALLLAAAGGYLLGKGWP